MINKSERPINIKDLVIDVPVLPYITFNPESEISQQDFDSMNLFLDAEKLSNPSEYSYSLYEFAVMFPGITKRAGLDANSRETVIKNSLSKRFDDFAIAARNLKVLVPDYFSNSPFESGYENLLRTTREAFRKRIEHGGYSPKFLEQLLAFKIAYPDLLKTLGMKPEAWNQIKADANRTSSKIAYFGNARVLFPEHQDESLVDKSQIAVLKRATYSYRQDKNWKRYLDHGYDLLLITADKIVVDDNGITITPKISGLLEPVAVSIPETRRY